KRSKMRANGRMRSRAPSFGVALAYADSQANDPDCAFPSLWSSSIGPGSIGGSAFGTASVLATRFARAVAGPATRISQSTHEKKMSVQPNANTESAGY